MFKNPEISHRAKVRKLEYKEFMKKTLIYGIGNPLRTDDTVGIKISEELKKQIKDTNTTIKSGSIDGLALLDEIVGFDRLILIDSIKTKNGKPGDIYWIKLDPIKELPNLSVSHGINFITALKIGKKLGYTMPKKITIYAIEVEDNISFNEDCTEKVKRSMPKVVARIIKEITK